MADDCTHEVTEWVEWEHTTRCADCRLPQPPAGVSLIYAERQRQVTAEGWTPEHDDEHDSGELVLAARCYAQAATAPMPPRIVPRNWPWHISWWKPSQDPIRNLVKAGALIAAEIDRLQRKGDR